MAEASTMQGSRKGDLLAQQLRLKLEESLATTTRNAGLAEVTASTLSFTTLGEGLTIMACLLPHY
jgi:hypothetical protein